MIVDSLPAATPLPTLRQDNAVVEVAGRARGASFPPIQRTCDFPNRYHRVALDSVDRGRVCQAAACHSRRHRSHNQLHSGRNVPLMASR